MEERGREETGIDREWLWRKARRGIEKRKRKRGERIEVGYEQDREGKDGG